jgi:hypothetical protein
MTDDQLVSVMGSNCIVEYHRSRASSDSWLFLLDGIAYAWRNGDPATRYLIETTLARQNIVIQLDTFAGVENGRLFIRAFNREGAHAE